MKEHITDMPHCWCGPRKEVQPGGGMVIVHRCDACFRAKCICDEEGLSQCCSAKIVPSGIPFDGTNAEFTRMCGKCGN